MKRLVGICLSFAIFCTVFVLGISAARGDYGYCDTDHDGRIEFSDALANLKAVVNNTDKNLTLVNVLYSFQAAIAGESLAATINFIDTKALTATVSTEYFEKITVPLSVFGLDGDVDEADYQDVPAVICVHAPAKTFAERYDGTVNGIYAAEANLRFTDNPANIIPLSMDDLNKEVVNGSHASYDLNATTLEMSYRDNAVLSSDKTTYTRYDKAWYPRVRKVNDNLYLLVYMYSQFGQHLYYATSQDGTNWNKPEVLWNSAHYEKFVHEDGPLAGTTDAYHAMNPDICVLDDGSVICVYAVRAVKGYRYYPDLSGLFIKRGTPNADGTVTWSDETKIYTGQVWEPSIIQLSNGEIHIYFTQVAPDIVQYGYDENHRSTETGLIISNDNFETWTPDVQSGDRNYYRATTVFREYVGNMLDAYTNTYRPHYGGQMPVATELYNGKLFLATEIKESSGDFHISYNVSDDVRSWKALNVGEESDYVKLTSSARSSPYVDRFPSGEIYLTYNYWHNGADHLVGRIGKADGSSFNSFFYNAPLSTGIWGSCSVVGSHKTVTAMQHRDYYTDSNGNSTSKEKNTIHLYYHYLNHLISANQISVTVDGCTNEWENNTEALFVGSESQAQATLQVAHDNDNLYFLINRLDYVLTSKDKAHVYIAASDGGYYRIDLGKTENCVVYKFSKYGIQTKVYNEKTAVTKVSGTLDVNSNTDKGSITELSVPKSVLGLSSATSIKTAIGITNVDKDNTVSISDTMVDLSNTTNWPTVNLVK